MRKIKFRVWDKWNKSFVYINVGKPSVADIEALGIFANVEKQQYTGLKDKNGKEIYEGDIVQYKNPYEFQEPYYPKEHTEKFIVEWESLEYDMGSSGVGFNVRNHSPEFYEIIGNIYENPELLPTNESSTH